MADGFDMVIIRTSAINGSMSLWRGAETLVSTFGLNPEWLFFWLRIFATLDCVAVGNVGCALSFNSCHTWHSPYRRGNTHSLSVKSRNVVGAV